MSTEKKSISFVNQLGGLSRAKKALVIVSICLLLFFVSYAGAALITETSIFGPPSGSSLSTTPTPAPTATPVPTATPIPAYSGTVGVVTWVVASNPSVQNPATYLTGSTLTLSTTLAPASLKAQTVWFYYSNTFIPVDAQGIPTNPSQLVGIDTVVASAGVTTASVSFVVPSSGTYYYIAEIPVPV